MPPHSRNLINVLAGVMVALTILLGAAGCDQGRKDTPTVTRTLPPGVKYVTPTPELPTVVPTTPTPTPGILLGSTFDPGGPEVTLPLTAGTLLRVVERCFWDECAGYSLPPGTPVLAPFDGKVTIGPTAPDTQCSIDVAVYQSTDSEKGKLTDPPETVELAVGCDSVLDVKTGDTVKRGDLLLRLGQRGIYEGRADAPPTVLRFTCSYKATGCTWAGGDPHYFVPAPTVSPTPTPTGTPTGPTNTPTGSPTATGLPRRPTSVVPRK